MTERVENMLASLHASRAEADADGGDRIAASKRIDRIFEDLQDMVGIALLGAIARNFHGLPPLSTPHMEECDTLLARVDVSKVSIDGLVTLIRGTCMKKTLLPSWYGLRDRIRDEFDARKLDTKSLLVGLLEHQP